MLGLAVSNVYAFLARLHFCTFFLAMMVMTFAAIKSVISCLLTTYLLRKSTAHYSFMYTSASRDQFFDFGAL